MDATVHALGVILLNAVPTVLLVVLLYFYSKYMFFKPMEKVLRERYEATEGARKMADQSLARAATKAAEYEAAIRAARSEVYLAQDKLHKQLQEKEAAALASARQSADAVVREARAQLAQDVEVAKATLAGDAETLAGQIADSLLRRSAA
jgi:F-type H+-transporting ATPase subunit b